MSSLASEASLIIATFQLLAVRAVTNAARAADIASGDVVTPAGFVELPRRRFLDSDTFTPSTVSTEQSVTYRRDGGSSPPNETHVLARADRKLTAHVERCTIVSDDVPPIPNASPSPTNNPVSPIEPPWAVLPWMDRYAQTLAAMEHVKRERAMTDRTINGPADRGGLLDVVI